MIKHSNIKTFQDKMKNEETNLSKIRNLIKPEPNEISSMYDRVSAALEPAAASFNIPEYMTTVD